VQGTLDGDLVVAGRRQRVRLAGARQASAEELALAPGARAERVFVVHAAAREEALAADGAISLLVVARDAAERARWVRGLCALAARAAAGAAPEGGAVPAEGEREGEGAGLYEVHAPRSPVLAIGSIDSPSLAPSGHSIH